MENKEIPNLYKKKEECYGCGVCQAICKQEAIEMLEDEEGFLYPQIIITKCIACFMCVRVCPFKCRE